MHQFLMYVLFIHAWDVCLRECLEYLDLLLESGGPCGLPGHIWRTVGVVRCTERKGRRNLIF